MKLNFEWDERKNAANQTKHGVSFEAASEVFRDPYHLEIYDSRHSLDEDRYVAVGKVGNILFVVFTERSDSVRIISARPATPLERRWYYDSNPYD